jgi:hypothetical protein
MMISISMTRASSVVKTNAARIGPPSIQTAPASPSMTSDDAPRAPP